MIDRKKIRGCLRSEDIGLWTRWDEEEMKMETTSLWQIIPIDDHIVLRKSIFISTYKLSSRIKSEVSISN